MKNKQELPIIQKGRISRPFINISHHFPHSFSNTQPPHIQLFC